MAKKGEAVWFSLSPEDNPEAPHVLPPNSTAGEQWEFDGIAEDGLASFMFGFYRDPNYAILGSGNLRCSIEIMFANGTSYAHVDYPSESIVETCADGTRGIWRDEEGYSYSFEITHDMQLARIGLDSPTVKGNVLMKSRTPPRYGDATPWPSNNASTLTVPFFHWFEPIPVGDVSVDLTVLNHPFKFTGMAGHNRFWSAFSWFSCLQGLNAVRAKLGPYSLSWISFRSKVKKGLTYHSAYLVEDGTPIFSATHGSDPSTSGDENYIIVEKKYDGKITGNLKDKVTGYELELVSPKNNKHWVFSIDHTALSFEYMLGRGTGGSGFACFSQGGPLGLKQYKGIALTEALTFPEKSPLFKAQYRDEL